MCVVCLDVISNLLCSLFSLSHSNNWIVVDYIMSINVYIMEYLHFVYVLSVLILRFVYMFSISTAIWSSSLYPQPIWRSSPFQYSLHQGKVEIIEVPKFPKLMVIGSSSSFIPQPERLGSSEVTTNVVNSNFSMVDYLYFAYTFSVLSLSLCLSSSCLIFIRQ